VGIDHQLQFPAPVAPNDVGIGNGVVVPRRPGQEPGEVVAAADRGVQEAVLVEGLVAVGVLRRPDQVTHGLDVTGGEPSLDLELAHAPTLSARS
jgi:hypothetical protein